MQKICAAFLMTIILLTSPLQATPTEHEELYAINNSVFAKEPGKCGIFSFSTGKEIAPRGMALFTSDAFNEWKIVCARAAKEWIYKGKQDPLEVKEYELCRNLTSELTLALTVIHKAKYAATNDMQGIRNALDPVVQVAKEMNASFFKKFKGMFAKETSGKNIIKSIKDILNKRVKELINDFNDKLKMSGKKNVKKLSL